MVGFLRSLHFAPIVGFDIVVEGLYIVVVGFGTGDVDDVAWK